jgi:PIN domain nuclease of toxin-antitoxin system
VKVNLLLDTHLLLWAAGRPDRLSAEANQLLTSVDNALWFSVGSIWEVVIKHGLGRSDFRVDPGRLRRRLIENGYNELSVLGSHVVALQSLPAIHRDPFDRILIAQAIDEGLTLLTSDAVVAAYPASIRLV